MIRRLLPIGSEGHWLGTDELGRDMIARLMYGGRLSLLLGVMPVFLAFVIGTSIGLFAGYVGGWINMAIMRTLDVFYAFPSVLLAVAVAGALGPGMNNTLIALTLVFVPQVVRVAESVTTQVRRLDYVDAARMSGAGARSIIRVHVLANVLGPVFVYTTGLVSVSLILGSGLSFLGLGVKPPEPEWGLMLNTLRSAIYRNPLVAALPGAMIFVDVDRVQPAGRQRAAGDGRAAMNEPSTACRGRRGGAGRAAAGRPRPAEALRGRRRRVRSKRRHVHAVDGISFSVARGETVGVVGESGCGKSTTARLIARLIEPDAGELVFDGEAVARLRGTALKAYRSRLQMVFQDSYASLNPRLAVGDAVAFGPRVHGLSRDAAKARARSLLERVGLAPDAFASRRPHELSGGQRQRVNIARALAFAPRMLILDEAVAALDKSVQAQVLNLLQSLKDEERLTYLFISHDLQVVHYLADRVIVMYAGQVVESGPVDALYRRTGIRTRARCCRPCRRWTRRGARAQSAGRRAVEPDRSARRLPLPRALRARRGGVRDDDAAAARDPRRRTGPRAIATIPRSGHPEAADADARRRGAASHEKRATQCMPSRARPPGRRWFSDRRSRRRWCASGSRSARRPRRSWRGHPS